MSGLPGSAGDAVAAAAAPGGDEPAPEAAAAVAVVTAGPAGVDAVLARGVGDAG
jgi:hypothetical protein